MLSRNTKKKTLYSDSNLLRNIVERCENQAHMEYQPTKDIQRPIKSFSPSINLFIHHILKAGFGIR